MHQLITALERRLVVAIALGALGALTLGACGGGSSNSSNSSSKSSNAAATTPQTRPRFSAMRECLQRNGVKLPSRPGGARGLFLGGGQLPPGVTRSQLQAAMRKCFGGRRGGPGAGTAIRRNNPRFRQALSRYAACLRQNGVNVPAPNTSGGGPIFATKGIDTTSPQFRAATRKCRGVLTAAFQR